MKKFKPFISISIIFLTIIVYLLITPMFINNSTKAQVNLVLSEKAKKNTLELESLRPLTVEQVNEYVKNKKVIPLSVKNINNYTIILYQTKDFMGYYVLSSAKDGSIKYENGSLGKDNSHITPVSVGLGGRSVLDQVEYDFAWIIINDNELLKKAYSITLTLNNGTKTTEFIDNKKGIILENPKGISRAIRLNIYDKNKQNLYVQKL